MATLIANNSEASISRLSLRPGINLVGRAEGNHHVIPHGSVSSRHCEIVWNDGAISVRDLGSTNGTFIDDRPVQQQPLAHGQRLRFGVVEYLLEAPEIAAPRPTGLRVNVVQHVKTVESAAAPVVTHTAQESIAAIRPVMYEEQSFYRLLPGTFGYPFKSKGIILLVLGAVVFLFLEFLSGWSFLIKIISTGYFFAYMQRIVAFTAQGEDEMPDFPEFGEWWSDIILPYLLFVATMLASFLPALVFFFSLRGSFDEPLVLGLFFALLGMALIYYPMALLAVAVSDSFVALSPHIVLPSICRVFLPYLVTLLLLAGLAAVRFGTEWGLKLVDVPVLPTVVTGFLSLYLFVVMMRVLGLLFRCHRARLGWLG
jgi:FHA domain